jgi:hypothetical protein
MIIIIMSYKCKCDVHGYWCYGYHNCVNLFSINNCNIINGITNAKSISCFTFDITNTPAMDIITMLVAMGFSIIYIMFNNNGTMTVIATHNNRYVHSCNALLELATPINLCKRNKLKHLLPSDVIKI